MLKWRKKDEKEIDAVFILKYPLTLPQSEEKRGELKLYAPHCGRMTTIPNPLGDFIPKPHLRFAAVLRNVYKRAYKERSIESTLNRPLKIRFFPYFSISASSLIAAVSCAA